MDFLYALYLFLVMLLLEIFFSFKVADNLKLDKKLVFLAFFYHLCLAILNYYYVLKFSGDATTYFDSAKYGCQNFGPGTAFVNCSVYFVRYFFDANFFVVFFIFQFFSFLGFLLFLSLGVDLLKDHSRSRNVFLFFSFLPGVHFWTSAIGKDAVNFFGIALLIWGLAKDRKIVAMFGWIFVFLVRPHIAFLALISLTMVFLIDGSKNLLLRVFLFFVGVLILVFIFPYILQYANVNTLDSVSDVGSYVSGRQGYNQAGDGGIDLSKMNVAQQIFAYIFRPLFFDAKSISMIFASFENFFILMIFLYGLKGVWINIKNNPFWMVFVFCFFFLCLFVLAPTTANLGIALRQKQFFVYPFVLCILINLSKRKC